MKASKSTELKNDNNYILFSYTFVLIYENINIILFGAFPTKTARLELAPETSQQATLLMRPTGRNASCVDGFWDQIYPRYFSGKCTKEYIFRLRD